MINGRDPRTADVVQDLIIREPMRRAEIAARLWRQVEMPKAGATRRCWLWRGAVTAAGDPRIQLSSCHGTLVRRVVYALCVAPDVGLPASTYLSTTCGNVLCVRPDHVRPWQRCARVTATQPRAAQAQAVA
jgi:hypothetical protein